MSNFPKATHGMTETRTYKIWTGILTRCNNPNVKSYKRYGGRGVNVCERWSLFANFLSDMGEAPAGMSIDRVDNDKGYSPGNCKWSSPKDQANNRRSNRPVTVGGVTKNIGQWKSDLGISGAALYKRLKNGWSLELALSTPARRWPCQIG